MMTPNKPLERSVFQFDKAIVFCGNLIVPHGSVYRVIDPDGMVATKTAATVEEAKEQIVEYEIRDVLESQIAYWETTKVITEDQAEVMRSHVEQLV